MRSQRDRNIFLAVICVLLLSAFSGRSQTESRSQAPPKIALVNGQWFDGESFQARTFYSVGGVFTSTKPARVDQTFDLAGTWIVPPFGDAHNHNISGIDEWDLKAIRKCLADGVFYVQGQGNLPLSDEKRRRLPMNRPDGPDITLAQALLTATGGAPAYLAENILMPQGYYPGFTKEMLKDHLYFTLDSEADLEKKWPLIVGLKPDFIKTILWASDEFEKRKDDPAYFGLKGLDPRLFPKIVALAHASRLRVSTHVVNAIDFHNAVAAGADEIAHLPFLATTPISVEDAKLAAQLGIPVITTCAMVRYLPPIVLPKASRPQVLKTQTDNLRLLLENGVPLAIGTDNPADSSVGEVQYLRQLGVFDNLTLLKMWTETTAKTIFPDRKIGALRDGFEASFLALEGNPISDFQNVHKIKMRFKQGQLLPP